MNHIGDLYYRGRGFKRDLEKAKEWWSKAAEAGHEEAKCGLEKLAPKSLGERLKLWLPMLVLFLMLLAVFCYFGYKVPFLMFLAVLCYFPHLASPSPCC
jgi:TPR repeat protein